MLTELPNGNWVDTDSVISIRFVEDWNSRGFQPRVIIDVSNEYGSCGYHILDFNTREAAKIWIKQFGDMCVEGKNP